MKIVVVKVGVKILKKQTCAAQESLESECHIPLVVVFFIYKKH